MDLNTGLSARDANVHKSSSDPPRNPPIKRRNQQHDDEEEKQQQRRRRSDPLKCPRCDSTNTKFCYYNNYNKSQPRHFCKACKRHWTSGGTLRNVPVGGGRNKKKRKISDTAATATTINTSVTSNLTEVTNHHDILISSSVQPSSIFSSLDYTCVSGGVSWNDNPWSTLINCDMMNHVVDVVPSKWDWEDIDEVGGTYDLIQWDDTQIMP